MLDVSPAGSQVWRVSNTSLVGPSTNVVRTTSTTSSFAKISPCDLLSGETIQANTSNSPVPAVSATHPEQQRRFTFIKGPSRPRKRRRTNKRRSENESRTIGPADSPTFTSKTLPKLVGRDSRILDEQQREYHQEAPEPAEDTLLEDYDLLDSIIPNIFCSTPSLDTEPPDPLTAGMPDLMGFSKMTPTPISEKAVRAELQPGLEAGPFNGTLVPIPQLGEDPVQELADDDSLINYQLTTRTYAAPHFHPTPVASSILPGDHELLLELYDSEYCILPLTGDIPGAVNPFRCKRQTSQGSRLLFHSILALCCQHLQRLTGIWSSEASEHRQKAVQLLECSLDNGSVETLLDPILILFTLDCTLSATGAWSNHLLRAYSMIQACGGLNALTTPRIRSQVGMLIWWDATLALISRRCPMIDQSYLQLLIRLEKQDKWSFFDLTGCPRELLIHLFNLAELAKQSEIASSMKWLTFNMAPVLQIEDDLNAWQNDFDISQFQAGKDWNRDEAEKLLNEQQDRYHCAEAWRHTLLLYVESVFKSDCAQRSLSIARLVRTTCDHIRCCRKISQTQKQLLLPVFLAGSHTSDQETREFLKSYCDYWGEKSRYSMFNSVPALFDEIWGTGKWWGAVIDGETRLNSGRGQSTTELLLG